ncbi:MAG: hypothetical protein JNJ54_22935 [Myxococcaceae bacterium]|nr:hypothetical protein [Myxococcaceae bacterium]
MRTTTTLTLLLALAGCRESTGAVPDAGLERAREPAQPTQARDARPDEAEGVWAPNDIKDVLLYLRQEDGTSYSAKLVKTVTGKTAHVGILTRTGRVMKEAGPLGDASFFVEFSEDFDRCELGDGSSQRKFRRISNDEAEELLARYAEDHDAPRKDFLASECQTNLKVMFLAEHSYYREGPPIMYGPGGERLPSTPPGPTNRYETDGAKVGFVPNLGNRFLYLLAPEGAVWRHGPMPKTGWTMLGVDKKHGQSNDKLLTRVPAEVLAQVGVHGECPQCSFVGACVANLDDDADVEVWTISTDERASAQGIRIPAGVPWRERAD